MCRSLRGRVSVARHGPRGEETGVVGGGVESGERGGGGAKVIKVTIKVTIIVTIIIRRVEEVPWCAPKSTMATFTTYQQALHCHAFLCL